MSEESLQKTVQELINKVEELSKKFDNHQIKFQLHENEMQPVIEGWKTIQAGRTFIVWIGAPLAVIGATVALFK